MILVDTVDTYTMVSLEWDMCGKRAETHVLYYPAYSISVEFK
jgi:hypothetical protein